MGIDTTQLQAAVDAKMAELIAVTNAITDMVNNPKVTYTRSGQNGSQTFDYNTYLGILKGIQREARESLQALGELQVMVDPYIITSIQIV